MTIRRLTRRDVLKMLAAGATGLATAACAVTPAQPPAPEAAPGPAAPSEAGTPKDGGTLNVSWGWPDHLNGLIASSARQHQILIRIHSRLVQWSKDAATIQPELATEWAFSDGDKTMTFKLNQDAKWSDGEPLTSKDVIYTLMMALHDQTGSRHRAIMQDIVGAPDYPANADTVTGLEAPDDYTVVIKTTQPSPGVWNVALPYIPIMPEHILRDVAPDKLREHPQMLFEPVTSGAYKMASSQDRQFIEVERWDEYWGKKPHIERIVGQVLDTPTAIAMLEKGELDFGGSYHTLPADVERLRTVPSLAEYKQPGVIPNNLDFNTSKPYLADKRIRQAVSYAIDRSLISEQVMKGLFIPWQTQFGYPWMQPIQDFQEYTFDPDKAKQLLEEAGYDTSLELDFLLSEEEPSNDLVVMQQMVSDVGMKWKFRTSLEPANTEDRQQGNFDVQGGGGIGWEADPSAMLPRFGCGLEWPNGGNFTRYCNPAWDEAMKAGASSLDPEQRKPHYWEAANILNDDLPTVFIMLRVNTYFINQRLHNATPQGLAMPNDDGFADWWLD